MDRVRARVKDKRVLALVKVFLKAGGAHRIRRPPRHLHRHVGGVISPCLLNVALHGMEHAAGVRYRNSARSDAENGPWMPCAGES
jgi:RNA-directed DNA polymerase